ncbi:hypothetical protein F5Y10DRAFT_235594 [Nemania abortiva]|nr:hypothetical protein F5Y10DRAFT_235594 [Nemania abortiva]
MNDGSEVVSLLKTGPTIKESGDRLYVTNKELLGLRRALFGEGPSMGTGWDDAINLIPEFISNHSMNNTETYQQLPEHMGVSNAAEARDPWFSQ